MGRFFAFILPLLLSHTLAFAASRPLPKACPPHYVVDLLGVLPADSLQVLNDSLHHYHATSGNRIVVVLTDTLQTSGMGKWPARQLLRKWLPTDSKAVMLLIMHTAPNTRSKVSIAAGKALEAKFPPLFAKHLGTDKVAGSIYDGHSHYYAITRALPYLKGAISGTFSAEKYEFERKGKKWIWFLAAGTLLLLIATLWPTGKKVS